MSRIGKKPITIPSGVTVTVADKKVTVKGPLGELSREFPFSGISVAVVGAEVQVSLTKASNDNRAFWGTTAAHIKNMIAGVVKAYEKKLFIEGIGFKWDVKGTELVMSVGFSHQVKIAIPAGVKIAIDNKGVLTVSGISKDAVGEFAAKIRSTKEPEPYKGKGIRYENEVVRRKQGKKTV